MVVQGGLQELPSNVKNKEEELQRQQCVFVVLIIVVVVIVVVIRNYVWLIFVRELLERKRILLRQILDPAAMERRKTDKTHSNRLHIISTSILLLDIYTTA